MCIFYYLLEDLLEVAIGMYWILVIFYLKQKFISTIMSTLHLIIYKHKTHIYIFRLKSFFYLLFYVSYQWSHQCTLCCNIMFIYPFYKKKLKYTLHSTHRPIKFATTTLATTVFMMNHKNIRSLLLVIVLRLFMLMIGHRKQRPQRQF